MTEFLTLKHAALTIAGSDSGGGAGLQADLKTFAAHGVFGCSVVTAITAQNTVNVSHAEAVDSNLVSAQLDAVFEDFPVKAIKTGMISSPTTISHLADRLADVNHLPLVLDPVLIATSGARLISDEAFQCLRHQLLPRAALITPNRAELDALTETTASSTEDAIRAAQQLLDRGAGAVLIKGGHWDNATTITDILLTADSETRMTHERLTGEYHGTGCTLSAAITANLAKGKGLKQAVDEARAYLLQAMLGAHRGLKGSLGVLNHSV